MSNKAESLAHAIAAEFGLSARAPHKDFINAIEAKMAELASLVQKENQA